MHAFMQTFAHPSGATLEYDPHADRWLVCQPMASARDSAGAACVGGEVFVVGGYGGPDKGGLRSVERAQHKKLQYGGVPPSPPRSAPDPGCHI